MMRVFAVAVVGLAFLGAEARPVVDASPDRVKYRLTPGVYLTAPGVDGGSWLPTVPAKGLAGGECMKFVGTIRPRDANEVGAANWVICPGAPERGFSRWEEQRDYIRPLGIKFLRVQVSWAKTEPEKGKFDFTWLDDIVDYCEKNGISPIFETSYGNPIHEGGGGATLRGKFPSGNGLLLWDDWVDRLTKRYGGRVKEWAGWNEPDMGNFAYNSIEDVASFALRTARIIRRNVPDAKIAGLSLAGCDPKHIDRLLELTGPEGLRIYDSIIYHGYKANPESQYDFVEGIRLAVARRAPHLVLWQGENGCPSESDDNGALAFYEWNELSQAKWDMRRMLGDFARGIRCSLFVLTDFQRPGCRTQNHKGLLRIDGDLRTVGIKTAYYAAQNVVSVFDSEVRVLPSRPTCGRTDMELFAFERKGKPILAFWQNNGRKDPPGDAIVHLGSALTLYWQDARTFEDPVWVDLLSGRVYEFPKRYILREGGFNIVNLLPLIDSPCLLAERAALEIQAATAAPRCDWAGKVGGKSIWLSTEGIGTATELPVLWGGSSPVPSALTRSADGRVTLTKSYSHPDHPDWAWTRTLSFVPNAGDSMECVFFETRANRLGKDVTATGTVSRLPPLPARPDLAAVRYGEPIDILRDGLDGFDVLDNGRASQWRFADGVLENGGSGANIRTKRGDFTDFRISYDVRVDKDCNSGVYLRGIYELQVSDSFGKPVDSHNMAALYGRIVPSVSAEKPAGEWQHVEAILCRRHLTVTLNGVRIIDNAPIRGITGGALSTDESAPGPIGLQGDHNGGAYRNMLLSPIIGM